MLYCCSCRCRCRIQRRRWSYNDDCYDVGNDCIFFFIIICVYTMGLWAGMLVSSSPSSMLYVVVNACDMRVHIRTTTREIAYILQEFALHSDSIEEEQTKKEK